MSENNFEPGNVPDDVPKIPENKPGSTLPGFFYEIAKRRVERSAAPGNNNATPQENQTSVRSYFFPEPPKRSSVNPDEPRKSTGFSSGHSE